jgi:subtilisin family serine protease
MNRFTTLLLLCAAVSACSDNPLPTTAAPTPSLSAALIPTQGTTIAGRYIVGFKNSVANVDAEAHRLEARHRGVLQLTYKSALKGMTLQVSAAEAESLRAEPNVAFVEQDRMFSLSSTETGATWGIDRIDQRTLPLSGSYSYSSNGSGVTVYMLDTGIDFTHAEFGGRAVTGVDIVTPGGTAADCHGHGSGTAGVVGGTTYGVAKNVKLVAVRVVDCNGNVSTSYALAGIDWVTAHRVLPAVANMSLQGGYSAALNQGVANAVASGVTVVVAAGNSSDDACSWSPASAPAAITVGATDINDGLASFSDYGSCVALNAPGVNITSADDASNTATKVWSGTSFASPHVAGLAALYLQTHTTATPAQVRSWLVTNATSGRVSGLPSGTPNLLAYSPQVTVTNQAPVARYSVSCPTLQCTFDASTSTDDVGVVSYTWNWGNGKTETHSAATAKNSFATTGNYTVTLTVTDGGGLSNSITNVVTVPTPVVNNSPVANFTWSCANPVYPHQCSFDASSSTAKTSIVSYRWDWGNGRVETRTTPTTRNTWATPGTVNVALTITDSGGLTSTITKSIAIP